MTLPIVEICFKEDKKNAFLQSYVLYTDDASMQKTTWLMESSFIPRFQFSGYPLMWDYSWMDLSPEHKFDSYKYFYLYPYDDFPLGELSSAWFSLDELYEEYVKMGQAPPTLVMEVHGSLYVGGYATVL
jgi:hypothetical protein